MENLRLPPQDIEAEKNLLGAILLDAGLMKKINLEPLDFYKQAHQHIFRAMQGLDDINIITVSDGLSQSERLDSAGGASYISELANLLPVNPLSCEKIIQEKSDRRKIMQSAIQVMSEIDTADIDDLMKISRVKARNNGVKIVSSKELSAITIDYVDRVMKSPDHIVGIPSGFMDLDAHTSGFQKSDFIILAGRPSMGKSLLKGNIALNCGVPVGIFEFEMGEEQNGLRYFSSLYDINHESLRLGRLNREEYQKTINSAVKFAGLPIHQTFDTNLPIETIKRVTRQMVDDYGIELMMIDYLQLIPTDRSKNKEEEVGHIANCLKGLAKELKIPIIALAQLNRDCEKRNPKKPIPMLSDLRESGNIEQAADIVMFLYRDDYYASLQNRTSSEQGIARVIIAKSRNSRTGTVKLQWAAKYMKLRDLKKEG